MSFSNAVSDRDYAEQRWGAPTGITRTCSECHRDFTMSREEPYVAYPLCDQCCLVRDEDARRAREAKRHAER